MIIRKKTYDKLLNELDVLRHSLAQAEADRFRDQERLKDAKQMIGQQRAEINILKQKLFAKKFPKKNKSIKKEGDK